MDGFEEKKWFVYVGDHHEGPYSLAEIQGKMATAAVSPQSYVWAEGMPDWKPMTEVPAFESLSGGTRGSGPTTMTTLTPSLAGTGGIAIDANDRMGLPPGPGRASAIKAALGSAIKWLIILGIPVGIGAAYMQGYLDPVLKSPGLKSAITAADDFVRPQLAKLAQKIPALAKWISPIPALEGVSPDDYEALKVAALTPIANGPKAAAAASQEEPFAPYFYIATNLPDGAQLELSVEGIPDTLLNHLSFTSRVQVTTAKQMGRTGAIRFPDGKPLPRGEYNVFVTEVDSQPPTVKSVLATAPISPATELPSGVPKGRKIVSKKLYFLGGKKDATYLARLKDFHDKLRAKATSELTEIKQFAATLENQVAGSTATFAKLRRGRAVKAQQKAWNTYHTKWMQLDGQLAQTFQKWTPQALESEYFYGPLYKVLQQAGQEVQRVHSAHHAFFTGAVDPKSFDIQLGEAASQAQTSLTVLKAKIDQMEKLQPTPNGMPRRDGL